MSYRNAKYVDLNRIDCEINHADFGWIPYTLDPLDGSGAIDNKKLHSEMMANNDVEDYVRPTDAELYEIASVNVRLDRNDLLEQIFYPIALNPVRWEEMPSEKKKEWKEYRSYLKDIPKQPGFPHHVTWPKSPV